MKTLIISGAILVAVVAIGAVTYLAVERGHLVPRGGELEGLAAGRGAGVEHAVGGGLVHLVDDLAVGKRLNSQQLMGLCHNPAISFPQVGIVVFHTHNIRNLVAAVERVI